MNPEEQLEKRIMLLAQNVLKIMPVPSVWLTGLDKHILPFAKEIANMSRQYVEAKRAEQPSPPSSGGTHLRLVKSEEEDGHRKAA